jgi:hypothetical protein
MLRMHQRAAVGLSRTSRRQRRRRSSGNSGGRLKCSRCAKPITALTPTSLELHLREVTEPQASDGLEEAAPPLAVE